MKRIISLSSIPPRFPFLQATLTTLLEQESVDEIRLYIPKKYKRFPKYNGKLPNIPKGITLCQIDEDFGPATKIIPAIQDFIGEDVQILFCDDDLIYHKNWAKKLFDIQLLRPNDAVATYGRNINGNLPDIFHLPKEPNAKSVKLERDILYRAKRLFSKIFHTKAPLWRPIAKAGYIDILFGVGGVVVRPSFFDEIVFSIPNEAFAVDDIWLSANLAKNKISIYCPRRFALAQSNEKANINSLLDSNFGGKKRQDSNRQAALYCQKK